MSHSPWPDLALLDVLLEREQMARSPDVWINIHRLLLSWTAQGRLPESPRDLATLIGPLVCKYPQQQQRFPAVVDEWLTGQKPAVQAAVSAPEQVAAINWKRRIREFKRRSVFGWLMVLALVSGFAYTIAYWPQDPVVTLPAKVESSPDPGPIPNPGNSIPITDSVAPNLLPPPQRLPGNWRHREQLLGWIVPSLPLLILILWLIWRYRGRTVLRNQAPEGEKLLTRLNFKAGKDTTLAPFSGPETASAMSKLMRPRWIQSRRLNIENSVIATARRSGFFTPRYRQRHIYPDYLFLVQSRHGADQAAAFAETLVEALRERRVNCRGFRFRDDPRRLIPWLQPAEGADRGALSLAQLAQRHAESRLIVISDWDILFLPYHPDQPQDWVKDFARWERRVWLSAGYDNARSANRAARQAQDLNFRLLPLQTKSIPEWVDWLLQEGNSPVPPGQTGDDYLPAILGETAETWLDWRAPHGIDLKRLYKQLQEYLGADGFLLLQALAVFPKPISPLPHVFDIQLFSELPGKRVPTRLLRLPWQRKQKPIASSGVDRDTQMRQARERRLGQISRLPWSRHAYMPDYLRQGLLKGLNRKDLQRIRRIWAALLDRLSAGDDLEAIGLPIAVPKSKKINLRPLLDASPEHSALNDPIFANILSGGKLGLLDFHLKQALARLLPGTTRWLDLRPALVALLLAVASVWGLNHAWQTQVKPVLFTFWQQRIERQNAGWQVVLQDQPETRGLAEALSRALESAKFQVEQKPAEKPPLDLNRIEYPRGGRAPAERLAQKLVWLTYGAEVELSESFALTGKALHVQLDWTYQHKAVFHDTLSKPYKPVERTGTEAKKAILPIEPEMVMIQPGRFMMGSPTNEAGGSKYEGPQHAVTIAHPFAIGKFEVTFAEYDRFAQATGRSLPDDSGLGRDRRPVINVSWFDAQPYARWLSQQTGKNYRLPSEAEWEFAARAGTTTANFWDAEGPIEDFAWYYENSRDQTHPVGEKRPNAFGLYDTSGNVYEWTQDCWHENYDQAPTDASAWMENNGGDCDRRVVRGGSWSSHPLGLRSALRLRDYSDLANYILGFRIARAL